MGFISGKAIIEGLVSSDSIILGPCRVGRGSVIDSWVMLGYLTREKLLSCRKENIEFLQSLDELSSGSIVGNDVVIRSGTVIYENVEIKNCVEIGHNVLVREHTIINENTKIGTKTVIEGYVRIGSRVNIQSMAYIPKNVVIEDNVFIGPNVVITNDKYPPSKRLSNVVIREGVVICANAIIIAGVEIGRNSVIAAGAVVTRDVEPEVVVVGVPARTLYGIDEYLIKKRMYEKDLSSS